MHATKSLSCLYLLAVLSLAGCAAPKGAFQSRRDPSYSGKLERVLVVYHNVNTESTLGRNFSDRLASRITTVLSQKSVPAEAVRLEKEVLDRTAPLRAAGMRFRPKQLLFLEITRANGI